MGQVSITELTTGQQNVNAAEINQLGTPLLNEFNGSIDNSNIKASAGIVYSKLTLGGNIVNADVKSTAAIAGSKIDPDFGAQDITTTGDLSVTDAAVTGDLTVTGAFNGKIVSFNETTGTGLSATATTTYTDCGMTGITMTPGAATNLLHITFGFSGQNGANGGGFIAAVALDDTENTTFLISNASTGNAGGDIDYSSGSFWLQTAAAETVFTVEFKALPTAAGTTTAKTAYLQIVEYSYDT